VSEKLNARDLETVQAEKLEFVSIIATAESASSALVARIYRKNAVMQV